MSWFRDALKSVSRELVLSPAPRPHAFSPLNAAAANYRTTGRRRGLLAAAVRQAQGARQAQDIRDWLDQWARTRVQSASIPGREGQPDTELELYLKAAFARGEEESSTSSVLRAALATGELPTPAEKHAWKAYTRAIHSGVTGYYTARQRSVKRDKAGDVDLYDEVALLSALGVQEPAELASALLRGADSHAERNRRLLVLRSLVELLLRERSGSQSG